MRLSREEFEDLVDEALESIPAAFERYMRGLAIEVDSMPDRQTCRELGLASPRDLLGLYTGVPLTERSVEQSGVMPECVILYQRNIERRCRTRDEVVEEIRRTILHEVGHHFGLDEEELRELGYE